MWLKIKRLLNAESMPFAVPRFMHVAVGDKLISQSAYPICCHKVTPLRSYRRFRSLRRSVTFTNWFAVEPLEPSANICRPYGHFEWCHKSNARFVKMKLISCRVMAISVLALEELKFVWMNYPLSLSYFFQIIYSNQTIWQDKGNLSVQTLSGRRLVSRCVLGLLQPICGSRGSMSFVPVCVQSLSSHATNLNNRRIAAKRQLSFWVPV